MGDEAAANTGVSQTPDGHVSETAKMARREGGNNPEVITPSGTSNTEVVWRSHTLSQRGEGLVCLVSMTCANGM